MISSKTLHGAHRRTYETIFQHPVSHNLGWHDVFALFRQLGQVVMEPNGNSKVTRNGQTLVLRPARTKDVAETGELMALRHFLERSETAPADRGPEEARWLLVIDHQEARIFHADPHGAITLQIVGREGVGRSRDEREADDFSRGVRKPDPRSFFESVATALESAGSILIFGTGAGAGSEMGQFIAWVKIHDVGLAGRIAGSMVVDEHHLTQGQLLAKARAFYAEPLVSAV